MSTSVSLDYLPVINGTKILRPVINRRGQGAEKGEMCSLIEEVHGLPISKNNYTFLGQSRVQVWLDPKVRTVK